MQQEERVRVKQGKLGYFIGHQTHVQSAEADEEVVIKPGGDGASDLQHTQLIAVDCCCCCQPGVFAAAAYVALAAAGCCHLTS
jgi:hypothetical protein